MQLDEKSEALVETLALLLKKEPNRVLYEALESYLEQTHKAMAQAHLEEQQKETNLSFDEFWDDVELD